MNGGPLGVMSSLAMKGALLDLIPVFEASRGTRVSAQWVGGVQIAGRLREGDASDLVILAAAGLGDLESEGLVARGSRVDLVRSRVGVAVRHGAPRPGLGDAEAVKRAVLSARRVAYSSGPSGVYLAKVFRDWAVAPDRLVQTPPGAPAGAVVACGEADIAFQQVSELLPVEGIDYVGSLPDDLQLVTVFCAGINARARQPQLARELARHVTSADSVPVLRRHGLEPA